jgi:endonuclease/exonuclease/phosphatase family metal-dependent hydrolase
MLLTALLPTAAHGLDLRVLTLNIQNDGRGRIPLLVSLIQKSGADIVALQESGDATAEIGSALGFHWVSQSDDLGIVSRWPIAGLTAGRQGARIEIPDGRLDVFNVHLYYKPYQPYQLLHIPYQGGAFLETAAEAVAAARAARGRDVEAALRDISLIPDGDAPVIVAGDFNEPSWQDWTDAAVAAGHQPLAVAWPSTRAFTDAGFRDAYRTVWPDEVRWPGNTWTPTTRADDPHDHHDRIDFVMFRGKMHVLRAQIVGEDSAHAQIVTSPYPTDHRGVVATFRLP